MSETQTDPQITLFDYQPAVLKDRIMDLLIKNPLFRESDELLVVHIWKEQVKSKYGTMNVNVGTFLNDLSDYKFISYESIRRYRQLVQNQHPDLRGKNRSKRISAKKEIRNRLIKEKL